VDVLPGAHVELREMQRALDDAALQPAARQRRVAVTADVAERVKGAIDMRQHNALTLDRDKRHRSGRHVRRFGDGDKAFFHCPISETWPSPTHAARGPKPPPRG